MSMIGNYKRISPEKLSALVSNSESISDLLYSDEASSDSSDTDLDIDKSWHAIHFLLTSKQWDAEPPLGNAVLGGTPIGEDVGYGPARFLTSEQVTQVAVALSEISRNALLSRFNQKSFSEEEIYSDWEGTDEDFEYIGSHYERLVLFFSKAAQAGDAMLIYIN